MVNPANHKEEEKLVGLVEGGGVPTLSGRTNLKKIVFVSPLTDDNIPTDLRKSSSENEMAILSL